MLGHLDKSGSLNIYMNIKAVYSTGRQWKADPESPNKSG